MAAYLIVTPIHYLPSAHQTLIKRRKIRFLCTFLCGRSPSWRVRTATQISTSITSLILPSSAFFLANQINACSTSFSPGVSTIHLPSVPHDSLRQNCRSCTRWSFRGVLRFITCNQHLRFTQVPLEFLVPRQALLDAVDATHCGGSGGGGGGGGSRGGCGSSDGGSNAESVNDNMSRHQDGGKLKVGREEIAAGGTRGNDDSAGRSCWARSMLEVYVYTCSHAKMKLSTDIFCAGGLAPFTEGNKSQRTRFISAGQPPCSKMKKTPVCREAVPATGAVEPLVFPIVLKPQAVVAFQKTFFFSPFCTHSCPLQCGMPKSVVKPVNIKAHEYWISYLRLLSFGFNYDLLLSIQRIPKHALLAYHPAAAWRELYKVSRPTRAA